MAEQHVPTREVAGPPPVDETTTEGPLCSKCGNVPAGPGGILCPGCKTMIESQPALGTGGE